MPDLPEPSPLANPLPELVAAADRADFADANGLSYRDGLVKVEIELVPSGELPEQYLAERAGVYGDTAQAWVAVEDLVALATHEDVRIVRPPPESKPAGSGQNRLA